MLATNRLVTTSLFIACGLLLPMLFHSFGLGGKTFLPMHIPVLMGGLLLGWLPGLLIGILTPLLSCILTGMPPLLPSLPMMLAELPLYGAVTGYLYHSKGKNIYLSLISAMLLGRLGAGIVLMFFADLLGISLPPLVYVATTIATGMIGIIIQLSFIPLLVTRLKKIITAEVLQ